MGTIGSGTATSPQTNFTCDISGAYTPEDNETYINKLIVNAIECPDIPLSQEINSWNCSLCGNDEKYEMPIIDGDILMLQFKVNLSEFTDFVAFVLDPNGDVINDDPSGTVGVLVTDDNGNTFLNIQIIADNIDATCFCVKLFAIRCEINEYDLEDCISTKEGEGETYKQAYHDCIEELCEDLEVYYTDFYRKTNDDCEETILIEGTYTGYDCQGNYYGGSEADAFVMRVRVPGTIEQTDYEIDTTDVNKVRRTSLLRELYRLRTHKIPPAEAVKATLALAGKQFYVDSIEYKNASKVAKNNDEGRMWILDVTMNRECNETDFGCTD